MAALTNGRNNLGAIAASTRLEELIHERRPEPRPAARLGRGRNVALWIVQVLLAALFLFAGGTKLLLPLDVLASMGSPNQIALPGWFIRFIGTAEVLGALGLILPGVLRIRVLLTPLAAAGLVVIMAGATVITAATGDIAAIVPLVAGILAALVVRGRWD
jgi:hypothetical protein